MSIREIIFIVTAILIGAGLYGQNISGTITDEETGKIVSFANVMLLSVKDSVPFNMAVSDSTGYFAFKNMDIKDSIILTVQHLSYFSYQQIITNDTQFPLRINLKPSAIELNAVNVTSAAPIFKMQGTTLNVQVEGSVLSNIGNLPQMLQYLPFVNFKNGEIQIFGKGEPIFYINNRLERDINKITELNSNEIKNIEVLMSPNAEYDASASAVIKIFLKNKQGDGWSGICNPVLAAGDYLSGSWRLNLNYRKNKTDIFGNIRPQSINTKMSSQTETEIADETLDNYKFLSKNTSKKFANSISGWIGFNSVFNENNSLGARFEYINLPKLQQTANRKDEQSINSIYFSNYQADNHSTRKNNAGYYVNAYYNGLWWKKLTINCNADFKRQTMDNYLKYNEITENQQSNIRSETALRYNLYSGKITFEYPIYKGKITLGSETVYTDYFQQYTSDYTDLYADGMGNLSRQQLFAGFVNIQYPVRKFVIEGGLRYENVKYDYFIDQEKQTDVSQKAGNFFPSLSLTFTDNNVNMSLTYKGGIARPEYYQLRAFTEYSSPYEYVSGNPYLQPTMSHEIDVSFTCKKLYFVSGYSYKKDLIALFITQYNNTPAIVTVPFNLPKYETLFIQANWNFTVKKWHCFADFGIDFPMSKLEIFDKIVDFRSPRGYLSVNNMISLPHQLNLYLNASFYSGGNENVYLYKPSSNIQAGVQKEIFIKNLTANLRLVDCFKTDTENYTYNLSNITQKINSYNGTRMLIFSLTYLFNNTESRYKNARSGMEEMQRL